VSNFSFFLVVVGFWIFGDRGWVVRGGGGKGWERER
jgi:hypothetical protein